MQSNMKALAMREFERRLTLAMGQLELGAWLEREGDTIIYHSPTHECYHIKDGKCDCPYQGFTCKHLIAVWMMTHECYKPVSIKEMIQLDRTPRTLYRSSKEEVRLEGQSIVYQNGSCIKSDIMTEDFRLKPEWTREYNEWRVSCLAH